MKLKKGIVIIQNGDEYIAVAADEAGKSFRGMIKMNETAAFIVEILKTGATESEIIAALNEKYDVSENEALHDVETIVSKFDSVGLIEYE